MLWYLLLTFVNLANACHSVWHTPTAMFPENLIELRFDERFIRKQRHLYNPGLRIFSGGLDKHGATSFDIVFKKDNALHDIIYNYVVEKPDEIRPALEEAFKSGKVACINVMTDPTTVSPGSIALANVGAYKL